MTATESEASKRERTYRCFLVRCWREEAAGRPDEAGHNGEAVWRFTVQDVGPDAPRRSFACLKDLEAFLESRFGEIVEER